MVYFVSLLLSIRFYQSNWKSNNNLEFTLSPSRSFSLSISSRILYIIQIHTYRMFAMFSATMDLYWLRESFLQHGIASKIIIWYFDFWCIGAHNLSNQIMFFGNAIRKIHWHIFLYWWAANFVCSIVRLHGKYGQNWI